MGSGFLKQQKQKKALAEQFAKMQKDMENLEVTGNAGSGLVSITMNGQYEMKKIHIDPKCLADKDDLEMLGDLIIAAHKNAVEQIESSTGDLSSLSGLNFPGM